VGETGAGSRVELAGALGLGWVGSKGAMGWEVSGLSRRRELPATSGWGKGGRGGAQEEEENWGAARKKRWSRVVCSQSALLVARY